MHMSYADILSRIAEPPRWWSDGVPRYDPYSPQDHGIYSRQNGLVRVLCQACRTAFLVSVNNEQDGEPHLFKTLAADRFLTGDPPAHVPPDGSRCAGETMGAEAVELLEAWERDPATFEWVRRPEHEGLLSQD